MFGLENQSQQKKKKKVEPFVFDLEKNWKDPVKYKEMKAKIEARIQQIKEVLKKAKARENLMNWG